MHADPTKFILPLFFAALIVFALYRRLRASLGRQPFRRGATILRGVLLAALCAMLLLSPSITALDLDYVAAGAIAGLVLAAYALRHTTIETINGRMFYTAHRYIGFALVTLLFGRIVFRFTQIQPGHPPANPGDPFAALTTSPTTMAFYFLLAAYYVVYGIGLVGRARRLPAANA